MTNRFPTSVDPRDLGLSLQPDPEPERKRKEKKRAQTLWAIIVPIAAVLALGLSIVSGANLFLPAWFVFSLLLWGGVEGMEKE